MKTSLAIVVCLMAIVVSLEVIGKPSTSKSNINLLCQVGQPKDESIFAEVPLPLRERLIQRLTLLIEYRRGRQWDKFSGLLSHGNACGRTREQIIQGYNDYPGVAGSSYGLVDFKPKATSFLKEEDGKWIISGCAKLSGVAYPIDAFVVASRENDDWYFSDVDTVLRDTGFKRCSVARVPRKRQKR